MNIGIDKSIIRPGRAFIDLTELGELDELYIVGCTDCMSRLWDRNLYPSLDTYIGIMRILATSPYSNIRQREVALKAIEKFDIEFARELKRELCSKRRRQFGSVRESVILALMERDGYKCNKCGTLDNLQVDHIIPLSRGGTDDHDNLQFLCRRCNLSKRDRMPCSKI